MAHPQARRSLFERGSAAAEVERLFAEVTNGRGAVLSVVGSAGSGKTAFLSACSGIAARHGGLFLRSTASRAERQLPLVTVRRLFAAEPSALLADAVVHLDESMSRARPGVAFEGADMDPALARLMHVIWVELVDLSGREPLLLVVDDGDYLDAASRNCLLYIASRAESARILLMVGSLKDPHDSRDSIDRELSRIPGAARLRLNPLSGRALARMAEQRFGSTPGFDLLALTGGNPALVEAALRDAGPVGGPPDPGRVPGLAFRAAVVDCLHRGEPAQLDVARCLAILVEPPSFRLLSQFLRVDVESLTRVVDVLSETGLLVDLRFRHQGAADAVLADMTQEERSELYLRAAVLLYSTAAPAVTVARYLLAAGHRTQSWMVPVLEEAAAQLPQRDSELAFEFLQRAHRISTDPVQQATLTMKLALGEWRIDPATAARYHPTLMDAIRRNHLSGRYGAWLVRALLWNGQFEDAAEALRRISEFDARTDAETAAELHIAQLRIAHSFPPMLPLTSSSGLLPSIFRPAVSTDSIPVVPVVAADSESLLSPVPPMTLLRAQTHESLLTVLTEGGGPDVRRQAESALTLVTIGDAVIDTVQAALQALLFAGEVVAAMTWCDRLLADPELASTRTWRALLWAIRAEISLRCGDLIDAEEQSQNALALLHLPGWGVVIGGPLGSQLAAATGLGRYQVALERAAVPVPNNTFQTRFGLHYLRARGHYRFAIGQIGDAVADFEACGEAMVSWGMDLPALVPWRIDLARVMLCHGQLAQARRLALEQLERPGLVTSTEQAMASRVLVITGPQVDRPAGLRALVPVLLTAGAKLEAARTWLLLADSLFALGDEKGGREAAAQTWELATACGAAPLGNELRRMWAGDERRGPFPWSAEVTAGDEGRQLTQGEARVAELAATGQSNKEIASALHVTVSTVEQHLTRVYRKVGVRNRSDLRVSLADGPVNRLARPEGSDLRK